MEPFICDKNHGLSLDLAAYLTKKSNGSYCFEHFPLPRNRLDKLVEKGAPGIVAWSSPVWHGDMDGTKYLWTPGYFEDSNSILSNSEQAFEYTTPHSFAGLKVGGLLGYFYDQIDELAGKGVFNRVDVYDVKSNFKRLLSKRIDVAIVSESTTRYLISRQGLKDQIHFSTKPHSEYSYQMMVMDHNQEIGHFLSKIAIKMPSDSEWHAIFEKYR